MILSADDLRWYRDKNCLLLDGAFDPLHGGHLQYFADAIRAFPGHLCIVAVASDDDIRAKGREPLFDQRTRAELLRALKCVDLVLLKDRPVEHILGQLKPSAYIKGADWDGKLPPEQLAACALYGVQIVYLNTVTDSSTERLRAWARKEDAAHLERLERIVGEQQAPTQPWQPVTDYGFAAREAIEGRHPDLIREVFQPTRVLDAGCGPGHLVRLLRDRGVEAYGFDLNPPSGEWFDRDDLCSDLPLVEWNTSPWGYDVVVNRECLEHIPLRKIPQAVANLCKLSTRFVYVTTRFAKEPAHLLDVDTSDDLDPTHITMLNQDFLRTLFVLNGGKRRKDLETKLDWQNKGRCLVYEL